MSTGSLQVRTDRAKLRSGEVLNDKWHLDGLLGVGGTAAVYSATHRNGKRAAIKILHRELVANQELVTRFLREGYVANRLQHPGAVSILDDDRTSDGCVFLVMELLHGYSLDRYTREGKERLAHEHIFHIADEVLDVLAEAHARGVIHRDIKPANVFLQRDGRVKVLDFGIARLAEPLADGTMTQTGSAIGTPAFMPPEQARGRWNLIDARTDVWALGATLFALIIGERPRRSETVQEELLAAMSAPMPTLASRVPGISPAIANVIDRALAFEMNGRWADARAMQEAVRGLFTSGTLRASFVPPARVPGTSDYPEAPGAPQHTPQLTPHPSPQHTPQLTPQFTTGRPIVTGSSEAPPPLLRPLLRPWMLGFGLTTLVLLGASVLGWHLWVARPIASPANPAAPQPAAEPPSLPPLPAAAIDPPTLPGPEVVPAAPPTGALTPSAAAAAPQPLGPLPSRGNHRSSTTLPARPTPPGSSRASSSPEPRPEPKPDGDPFDNRF